MPKRMSHIEKKLKSNESLISTLNYDKNRKKIKGKTTIITKNLITNTNTTRTNISMSTFTSSINLINSINSKDSKQNLNGMIGNRLLSKPILFIELFLTLTILGILLIINAIIYYNHSFILVDSFITIMSTFRSLFAEIKFPVFSIKYFVILFSSPMFLISYLSTMSCKNIEEYMSFNMVCLSFMSADMAKGNPPY